MQITRKIQVRLNYDNKEGLGAKWDELRAISNATYRAYNKCMNILYTHSMLEEELRTHLPVNKERAELEQDIVETKKTIKKIEAKVKKGEAGADVSLANMQNHLEMLLTQRKSEKFQSIAKEISKDAIGISKLVYGATDTEGDSLASVLYDHIKGMFPGGYSAIPGYIKLKAGQVFNTYRKELYFGKVTLPSFKEGCPMPISKEKINNYRNIDKEFGFRFGNLEFITVNSWKDGSNTKYLYDVLQDWSKLADSQIQVDGNRIYFLMVVDQPTIKHELDPNLSVGVDLGMSIPAVVAISKGFGAQKIGTYEDLVKFKRGLRGKYSRQKSQLAIKGGQGRRGVDSFDDRYHKKERNYTHTYNHTISKRIIDFAVKFGAGVIKLEDLSFHSNRDEEGNKIAREHKQHRMLSVWPYAELQTMVEYKAKMHGIKVVYVDPAYTSQKCSCCGHTERGNRLTQSKFSCKMCGKVLNADINAAINIARSTDVVASAE